MTSWRDEPMYCKIYVDELRSKLETERILKEAAREERDISERKHKDLLLHCSLLVKRLRNEASVLDSLVKAGGQIWSFDNTDAGAGENLGDYPSLISIAGSPSKSVSPFLDPVTMKGPAKPCPPEVMTSKEVDHELQLAGTAKSPQDEMEKNKPISFKVVLNPLPAKPQKVEDQATVVKCDQELSIDARAQKDQEVESGATAAALKPSLEAETAPALKAEQPVPDAVKQEPKSTSHFSHLVRPKQSISPTLKEQPKEHFSHLLQSKQLAFLTIKEAPKGISHFAQSLQPKKPKSPAAKVEIRSTSSFAHLLQDQQPAPEAIKVETTTASPFAHLFQLQQSQQPAPGAVKVETKSASPFTHLFQPKQLIPEASESGEKVAASTEINHNSPTIVVKPSGNLLAFLNAKKDADKLALEPQSAVADPVNFANERNNNASSTSDKNVKKLGLDLSVIKATEKTSVPSIFAALQLPKSSHVQTEQPAASACDEGPKSAQAPVLSDGLPPLTDSLAACLEASPASTSTTETAKGDSKVGKSSSKGKGKAAVPPTPRYMSRRKMKEFVASTMTQDERRAVFKQHRKIRNSARVEQAFDAIMSG